MHLMSKRILCQSAFYNQAKEALSRKLLSSQLYEKLLGLLINYRCWCGCFLQPNPVKHGRTPFYQLQLYIFIMSFRWNLNQPSHNERSFITHGNELIATSIGLTANRSALSCRMNCDQHDYKYCKTEEEALACLSIFQTKLKRQAFRLLQKHTHYHREYTSSVFLPDALSHGNYGALSKFLENLRSNRVNAYVKLNLQESKGYFHKAATLLKPVAQLLSQRVHYGFTRLKQHMVGQREQHRILQEISRLSSIQNKDSVRSEIDDCGSATIRISYIRVDFNPEKVRNKSYTSREFSSTKKTSESRPAVPCLDLSEFIVAGKVKNYEFKHVNLSKMHSYRASVTYHK